MESRRQEICAHNSSNQGEARKSTEETDKAHITISEFLNFLKTAYQVQDSVEGVLLEGGMSEAVNWLKSKEIESTIKGRSMSVQTSDTLLRKGSADDNKKELAKKRESNGTLVDDSDILKQKLNEVLSEGLLDSVLPYLVQSTNSLKKNSLCSVKTIEKNSHTSTLTVSNERLARRKSSGDASTACKVFDTKIGSEVEIHVCDEIKNTKKTFTCNQKLLVEKMGYFAEVTLGQKLEDMDISVHCDIGIFEWLMQWVKKDSLLEADWPHLDSQCVIPILVSAAFLQMEPLLQDCLLFCHQHMNEILRTASNLSCLNDSVLTRLAAMYTNSEVELIKDRKDKIQSKLFSKLIQSLAEPEPESVRGHWCSLARIFRCDKCQQLITPNVAARIPCIPPCMRLQPDGSIISLHTRDPNWLINEYIIKLHKTLKTWRKVYWRLWGDVHFLYCGICKKYFPTNQIGWCRYHPDTPQFFTLDAQKAPLPIGRYPCCGERAYRFQLLENYSACQFRQHAVSVEDVRQSAIFSMLETYRHLIEEEPPELLFPERLTRLVARGPSRNNFLKCVQDIVNISNSLLDGWQLNVKTDVENGTYITKKKPKFLCESKISAIFEYHIAYSISYSVPVLCFNAWKTDGSMLTMEEYWANNKHFKNLNMFDTLTQMDHPVLCKPFLTLHPCRTSEIIEPILETSRNAVVTWLSVVGRFIDFEIDPDYFRYVK
ncbi:hypothetical protein D910_09887 [Dendroctonus ponderosae]|uniref:SANT and BTB domain-containing protein n=1 Tax=Dendroctonus ponderosae TaxID=77166 RepID=U4UF21_DENPD|nr:hypothetical protein D910_09887 [Dendroctonus ponderosae]